MAADELEGIAAKLVLLEEQEPHLFLASHLLEELVAKLLDLMTNGLAAYLELVEGRTDELQHLDEEAAAERDVERANHYILLVRRRDPLV